ncbi:MAG: hypothetical protein QM640_11580 [Niabella sp.]
MITFFAQGQSIDYKNIFCTEYNNVGIPKGNQVFICSNSHNKWQVTDTVSIPEETIAMDGNERKILFAQEDKVIFQLIYKNGSHWKQTWYSNPIASAEKKDPQNYIDMPYDKIYAFGNEMYLMTQHGRDVSFWLSDIHHVLNPDSSVHKELIPKEKLQFTLPGEVITVFTFDQSQIAWVYKDRIEFYKIKKDRSGWEQNISYPPLYFNVVQ